MPVLQYSQKVVPRLVLYKSVHNCRLCPYKTKSTYFMMNHVRRHQTQLAPVTCKDDIEMYYCEDCNFQTELTIPFKKHISTQHVNDNSFIIGRLRNLFICERCGFKTKFSYKWLKHMAAQYCKPLDQAMQRISIPTKTRWDKHLVKKVTKQFKCHLCSFEESRSWMIARHQAQVHLLTPIDELFNYDLRPLCHSYEPVHFKCKDCSYVCETRKEIDQHKRTHQTRTNTNKRYSCLKCSYKSPTKKGMIEHTKSHHRQPETINLPTVQTYKCVKCYHRSQTRAEIEEHIKAHTRNIKAHRTEHIKAHTSMDFLNKQVCYRCEKCSYKSPTKKEMIEHKKGHHKHKTINLTNVQLNGCVNLSYTNQIRKEVEEHIKTHPTRNLLNKRFKCGKCTFTSQTKTALEEHVHRHQYVKKYICGNCDFETREINVFQIHVIKNHLKVGLSNFKCDRCGYKSTNERNIFEHLVKAPGSCSDQKIVQCGLCSFSTKEKSHLKKHVFLQHFI